MPTVSDIINIAEVSQYLALTDIEKNGLDGGGIDLQLPRKLYCIRKNVEWLNDLDNTQGSLIPTANYLYSLCYKNGQAALISGGGGGGSIAPISGGGSTNGRELIRITGADFANATNWNGQNSDGATIPSTNNLQVYWNGLRYLTQGTEWIRTAQGFQILMAGFDATTTNLTDEFYIDINA